MDREPFTWPGCQARTPNRKAGWIDMKGAKECLALLGQRLEHVQPDTACPFRISRPHIFEFAAAKPAQLLGE